MTVIPAGSELAAAPPAVRRHHGVVRVAHWLNAVTLAGMIASGLQIYVAFRHFGTKRARLRASQSARRPSIPEAVRLGGWLAGGLNWHFALAWPFVITGPRLPRLPRLLPASGARCSSGRGTSGRPSQMQLYYLRLAKEHPPQGKHNALQKGAYTLHRGPGARSALSGFAIYKPVQLSWLTSLFGGFELARYWHFVAVWLFIAFTAGARGGWCSLVDPASLRP